MARPKGGAAALAAGKDHLAGGGDKGEGGQAKGAEDQELAAGQAGDKAGEEGRQEFTLSPLQRGQLDGARTLDAEADDGLEVASETNERAFWQTVGAELGFIPTTVQMAADASPDDLNLTFSAWPVGTEPAPERDFNPATNEADHVAAIARIEAIADAVRFDDITKIGSTLRGSVIDILRNRHKPWPAMTEIEKRDVATAIDYAIKVELRAIALALASQGKPAITAKLEKYADKAGEIVATVKIVGANDETVLALHRASGKVVMIVAADGDSLMGDEVEIPDDQHDLGFSAGNDAAAGNGLVEEVEEEDEHAEQEAEAQALYDRAVAEVRESDKVSPSALQRKLEIGHTLATQLIERMEREGVVSAPDVTTKRAVLPFEPAGGDNGEGGDGSGAEASAAPATA